MATRARTAAERQAYGAGLNRLARRYGVTQRDMLERLINAADGEIVATLDPTCPERTAYCAMSRVTR